MRCRIHHIEWSVQDVEGKARFLVEKFGFERFAETVCCNHVAVRSGETIFLLSKNNTSSTSSEVEYPVFKSPSGQLHGRDTVFNVCLEVEDVDEVAQRISSVISEPRTIGDLDDEAEGEVRVAVIGSCVGNVVHSLVDTRRFRGVFMPGFVECENSPSSSGSKTPLTSNIDHVTYVCRTGESDGILKW